MTVPAPTPFPRPAPMPIAVFATAGPCQCGHEADWRLPRCPAPNPKENR